MATIDDLDKVSITDMSKEELINLLREIRLSRRTPTRKMPPKRKAKVEKPLDVNSMTDEQALALLEKLEAGMK